MNFFCNFVLQITYLMNIKLIIDFLKDVAANNDRLWFQEHKAEYNAAREEWETAVSQAIVRISEFDPSVSHLQPKDCTYRFYRDTRFSADKSPYKTHFGAYINAKGKKALRGGYYIHVEPGGCLLAAGNYWLPTNILTSCRNEIMANEEAWLSCVENAEFQSYFGAPEDAKWENPQGFGLERLKTCPSGFPRDYAHIGYLRMKDYCAWHRVPETFFKGEKWLDQMETIFKAAKPMMDFMNNVIDDYE